MPTREEESRMHTWTLEETDIPLESMRKQESLTAQGNGYFGWRGTFEEGYPGDSLEGNYVNGFYETYPIRYPEIAYGYPARGQTMLNVMNAKALRITVDGEPVWMDPARISAYRRVLDFRTGLLTRAFVFQTAGGKRAAFQFRRLVSLTRPHCGAIALSVQAQSDGLDIEIISSLETRVRNQYADQDPRVGSHLPEDCLQTLDAGVDDGLLYALARTRSSGLCVACAADHRVDFGTPTGRPAEGGTLCIGWKARPHQGETLSLQKMIAYHAQTRPGEAHALLSAARADARDACGVCFDTLLRENEDYLSAYWRRANVVVEGDDALQQGLRFNSFHLLQSVGRDGLRNICAKGLTGEGYEGHYFWDTEMFVIPSLLYSRPDICRALLAYRYAHLGDARARAREMGHPVGALFPWRTIGGAECSTFFPAGTAQYHINGDIAHALMQYLLATCDRDFLLNMGAELLFETARLWYDLGHFNPGRDGLFCIDGVTGPDEYTAIVNNNVYTNRMAQENLRGAHEAYQYLLRESPAVLAALSGRIGLSDAEPPAWKRAADRMFFPYDGGRGVFLQDDSFAQKKPWDFAGTPPEKYPLLLHFHPLVIYRHQVLKQADTVLADLLLEDAVGVAQMRRDYDYYEPLTTHDSSLSVCVYSIAACRVGYPDKAYAYFMRAARTDLDDHKGNTKDGVHIANMAGTSLCVLQGFAGLRLRPDGLLLRPMLPRQWKRYAFSVAYRDCLLDVSVGPEQITLCLEEGDSLALRCYDETIALRRGAPFMLPLRTSGAQEASR